MFWKGMQSTCEVWERCAKKSHLFHFIPHILCCKRTIFRQSKAWQNSHIHILSLTSRNRKCNRRVSLACPGKRSNIQKKSIRLDKRTQFSTVTRIYSIGWTSSMQHVNRYVGKQWKTFKKETNRGLTWRFFHYEDRTTCIQCQTLKQKASGTAIS